MNLDFTNLPFIISVIITFILIVIIPPIWFKKRSKKIKDAIGDRTKLKNTSQAIKQKNPQKEDLL